MPPASPSGSPSMIAPRIGKCCYPLTPRVSGMTSLPQGHRSGPTCTACRPEPPAIAASAAARPRTTKAGVCPGSLVGSVGRAVTTSCHPASLARACRGSRPSGQRTECLVERRVRYAPDAIAELVLPGNAAACRRAGRARCGHHNLADDHRLDSAALTADGEFFSVGTSAQHHPAQQLGEHPIAQHQRHRAIMLDHERRRTDRSTGARSVSGTHRLRHGVVAYAISVIGPRWIDPCVTAGLQGWFANTGAPRRAVTPK